MTDALPDAELVAITYLRQHTAVSALVTDRVYPVLPADPTYPLVKVTRIGGPPVARGTLDAAFLQIEAYGTTKHEAREVAATAQAALADAFGFTTGGAYITETEPLTGLQWLPDPEDQQPRYLFDHTVYVRNS